MVHASKPQPGDANSVGCLLTTQDGPVTVSVQQAVNDPPMENGAGANFLVSYGGANLYSNGSSGGGGFFIKPLPACCEALIVNLGLPKQDPDVLYNALINGVKNLGEQTLH